MDFKVHGLISQLQGGKQLKSLLICEGGEEYLISFNFIGGKYLTLYSYAFSTSRRASDDIVSLLNDFEYFFKSFIRIAFCLFCLKLIIDFIDFYMSSRAWAIRSTI